MAGKSKFLPQRISDALKELGFRAFGALVFLWRTLFGEGNARPAAYVDTFPESEDDDDNYGDSRY